MCGLKGHVTPAADVAELTERDAGMGVDVGRGRRFVRCLRCDSWLDVEPPGSPSRRRLPRLDELEVPLRDGPLRDLLILRLIALDRVVHVFFFSIVAAAALYLYSNLGFVQSEIDRLLPFVRRALGAVGADPTHNLLTRDLVHLAHTRGTALLVVGATSAAYAVLEGAEAVGLWMSKRWAEYLTAIATAGFLPFEIRELIDRITAVRVGALVVNLAILAYLVIAKRLFGVRGGAKAMEHERKSPAELFGPPAAAGPEPPVAPAERPA